ncbi:hypothetical protein [Pedobacter hartonius]|uniref:Uncharacterized protein n=1 Tax=Pedobacter hartonius TaxID=425514 RepID=A0A1H4DN80_9SPHI|nr:hypothetical protein [Pedobacter hartonius]SEA73996.1 hypothetical protein SAMN05443550_10519 [Pedobacter hartonius]
MITTSTSTPDLNHLNQQAENLSGEFLNDLDLMFYESIKPQMDRLNMSPEDETISRILAYSKSL